MINKVILIGNVGSDPDVRTTQNGTKVAKIQIATTEKITDKSTNTVTKRTEWHSAILWRNLAEHAEKYIRKGAQIYVEGSIHYRKYTGNDGVERQSTDISVNEFKLLGRKADGQEQTASIPQTSNTPIPTAAPTQMPVSAPTPTPDVRDDVDDLPF